MKVIHTPTIEMFKQVNEILNHGLEDSDFNYEKENTCIDLDYGYGSLDFYTKQNATFLNIEDLPKNNNVLGFKIINKSQEIYEELAKFFHEKGFSTNYYDEDGFKYYDLMADFDEGRRSSEYTLISLKNKEVYYGNDNSEFIEFNNIDDLINYYNEN